MTLDGKNANRIDSGMPRIKKEDGKASREEIALWSFMFSRMVNRYINIAKDWPEEGIQDVEENAESVIEKFYLFIYFRYDVIFQRLSSTFSNKRSTLQRKNLYFSW